MILEKMRGAATELFGNDLNLSELLVFGYQLDKFGRGKSGTVDTMGKGRMVPILKPNKKDEYMNFYGGKIGSSYVYDTYETHVDSVEVDGGMEIGPLRKHPHFHILLTVNHWSYVQIDYYKMNAYLENMFKGLDPLGRGWADPDLKTGWPKYQLMTHGSNIPFYTDAEQPYVHIKMYPQDNWQDIIQAYVRKHAQGPIGSIIRRHGDVERPDRASNSNTASASHGS